MYGATGVSGAECFATLMNMETDTLLSVQSNDSLIWLMLKVASVSHGVTQRAGCGSASEPGDESHRGVKFCRSLLP